MNRSNNKIFNYLRKLEMILVANGLPLIMEDIVGDVWDEMFVSYGSNQKSHGLINVDVGVLFADGQEKAKQIKLPMINGLKNIGKLIWMDSMMKQIVENAQS